MCYGHKDECNGEFVVRDVTARECCVSREDGYFYSVNDICAPCRGMLCDSAIAQ